jgi:hypothetical protein
MSCVQFFPPANPFRDLDEADSEWARWIAAKTPKAAASGASKDRSLSAPVHVAARFAFARRSLPASQLVRAVQFHDEHPAAFSA